jgi:uncharacterized membrane protein
LSKVLTQSDVLKQYSQKISVAYQKQQLASQAIIQSIIEIRNQLFDILKKKRSLPKKKQKDELRQEEKEVVEKIKENGVLPPKIVVFFVKKLVRRPNILPGFCRA